MDSEWIGLLTGRWDDKFPQYPPIMQIPDRIDFLAEPTQAIAPALHWWPSADLKRFTERIDLQYPGMKTMLGESGAPRVVPQPRGALAPLVFNNQIIAHRRVVADWVEFMRHAFEHYDAKYGMELPFTVACPTCGSLCLDTEGRRVRHPSGHTYDPVRHAGYFYEQLTALYFTSRQLEFLDFDGSPARPRALASLAAAAYWRSTWGRRLYRRLQRRCPRPATAPERAEKLPTSQRPQRWL